MHFRYLFYLGLLFMISCTTKQLGKEEAVRSIKVLNSDIMNLLDNAVERDEVKALNFLLKETSAPIPFKKKTDFTYQDFNFQESLGEYFWDEAEQKFIKSANSEFIIINLENALKKDVEFIIEEYKHESISSRPAFPVKIKAFVKVEGKTVCTISQTSTITDDLPEFLNLEVVGSDYKINADLKRTKSGDEGTIDTNVGITSKGISIITMDMESNIGYSRQGYYFKQIWMKHKIFGHRSEVFSDYASVNPTAEDYAASFNENTTTELFEGRKVKVCNLVLAATNNQELLDYHFLFSDGSKVLVGEYLPVFDRIKNFKY